MGIGLGFMVRVRLDSPTPLEMVCAASPLER